MSAWRSLLIAVCCLLLSTTVPAKPATLPSSNKALLGNAERGAAIVVDQDKASCLLCHAISAIDLPFQGNIAPPLDGVGNRYTADELRFRLTYPQKINPDSPMPSYGLPSLAAQVSPEYKNDSIYTAQEMEDVIAFLLALKQ